MSSPGVGAKDSNDSKNSKVKAKDSKKSQAGNKTGKVQNERDNGNKKKASEFAKKCEAVRETGKAAASIYTRVKGEVFECRFQEHHFLHLRVQLEEAMNSGLIDGQACSNVDKKGEEFIPKLKHFQIKLGQGSQILAEWLGLAPLSPPGLEWVKLMAQKDPEALRQELDNVEIKIETESQFFQQLEEEWDASKESLSKEIEDAVELVGVMMLCIS